MNHLTGMYYSPWTERARWALDFHHVPYSYTEYTTLLGEPALRLKTGKLTGKVSVPLLVTPHANINDSFQIARFADANSSAAPLIPAAHFDAIQQWLQDAEVALRAGRIRATRRLKTSAAALAERLPAWFPAAVRPAFVPLSYLGASFILGKYRVAGNSDEQLLAQLDAFLAKAEATLANRDFVFEEFSFADIIIATVLQAVTPVDPRYIDLGKASSERMQEPELAIKYPHLLQWRDRLYSHHR